MVLQLGGLALKMPLTALLVFGLSVADAVRHAAGAGAGRGRLRHRDRHRHVRPDAGRLAVLCGATPSTRRFGLQRRRPRPARARASLAPLLRLGVPMGLSIMIEVTGFTFMAFFISRIGATPVAGHQIAVNMVSLMFMLPLAHRQRHQHAGGAAHRRRRPGRRDAASAAPGSRSAC